MKKIINIVVIIMILLTTNLVLAADDLQKIKGKGEALLGHGITIEQAEKISLMAAKRNAMNKFGTYIETETVVRNNQLTKDEITAISAGIVKLKAATKEVSRKLEGEKIIIETSGVFQIDERDFKERLKKYTAERKKSIKIKKLVERVNKLEKRLSEVSQREGSDYQEVKNSIDEVEQSYKELGNALTFSGDKIFASINNKRLARLKRLKNYLIRLKGVANPYQMFDLSIIGDPQTEDKGKGKIGITINLEIDLNNKYYKEAMRIVEEYKEDIYTVDDHYVDNITKDVLGPDYPLLEKPILITFLNEQEEIVAFYWMEDFKLYYQLHYINLDRYNQYKGAMMDISWRDIDIPWDNKEYDLSLYRELPEEIVKEITNIRVIYSKYDADYFAEESNYETYYHRYYRGYESNSYIYSTLPLKISELKFGKKDIINSLEDKIARVEAKIESLKVN